MHQPRRPHRMKDEMAQLHSQLESMRQEIQQKSDQIIDLHQELHAAKYNAEEASRTVRAVQRQLTQVRQAISGARSLSGSGSVSSDRSSESGSSTLIDGAGFKIGYTRHVTRSRDFTLMGDWPKIE